MAFTGRDYLEMIVSSMDIICDHGPECTECERRRLWVKAAETLLKEENYASDLPTTAEIHHHRYQKLLNK